MDVELLKDISNKLDMLVKLTAFQIVKDQSLKDQVVFLSGIGIQPKEIANILNKSPNHIYVMMNKIKKSKGAKNDKRIGDTSTD
ncbi:MAG: hypothetical protein ABIG95_05020 [Candidatus Woesearchaeota archaeon]